METPPLYSFEYMIDKHEIMMTHCCVFLQTVSLLCPSVFVCPADTIPRPSLLPPSQAISAASQLCYPLLCFLQIKQGHVDNLGSPVNIQEAATSTTKFVELHTFAPSPCQFKEAIP